MPGDRSSSWDTLSDSCYNENDQSWSCFLFNTFQHWYTHGQGLLKKEKTTRKSWCCSNFRALDILWVVQLDHGPLQLFPLQDVSLSLAIDYLCLSASGVTVYVFKKDFSLCTDVFSEAGGTSVRRLKHFYVLVNRFLTSLVQNVTALVLIYWKGQFWKTRCCFFSKWIARVILSSRTVLVHK